MKTTVLLVDGRKVLREGLRVLLEQQDDIRVIGEAEEAHAATRLCQALAPNLVVLTLTSSARGAAEQVKALASARSGCRLIALLMHHDVRFVREVLQAGGAGCLTKDAAADELISAIRTVAAGKIFLSPKIAETLLTGLVLNEGKPTKTRELSAREREVVRRIADGETTAQIAAALSVSSKTVETHRRRVLGKLGRRSVADLIKYAVREGLTSLETSN